MPRHLRGKQAVFILTVAPTFKPQRPWDWPPEATSCVLHARNLPMPTAIGFCRTFNKAALQRSQRGDWDRKWAIVARHLRGNCKSQPTTPRADRRAGGVA